MAPHATEIETGFSTSTDSNDGPKSKAQSKTLLRRPLKYSGSLDHYRSLENTPVIGTEFLDLQITNILNDNEQLRDLAIKVSERGVVFLRGQQMIPNHLKILAQKLGELSGKPRTSKLHKHTLVNSQIELATETNGKFDDELWVISADVLPPPHPNNEWHSDLAYENAPSDYSIVHFFDNTGDNSDGDTLWASGYEIYDRLSAPLKKMVDELEVEIDHVRMRDTVQKQGISVNTCRGAPENSSVDFRTTHPLVRTNPVTGWKSLYSIGPCIKAGFIKGVTKHESEMLNEYFTKLISQNHDLQVRFKWGPGDIAIYDNRSVFHTATDNCKGRRGNRVISIGEVPYYDRASTSRREALASEAEV